MKTYEKQYLVHLIHGEQSRPSTAIQCANLLQHIDKTMDAIFSSILCRINDNAMMIKNLKHRADVASAKVEKLKGQTNATQIFSSSYYPGENNYAPFEHLFNIDSKPSFMEGKEKEFEVRKYDPNAVKEKMDFFHVYDHHQQSSSKESIQKKGLGRLPHHLSSVSSLLLYNTTHNPYKEYMLFDPLGVVSGTRGEKVDETDKEHSELHEPPISIKEGDQSLQIANDEFRYLPDLTDLPELDLPMELPSLPGVANDLSYDAEVGPSIAPSVCLPDLPVFESISSLPSQPPPTIQPPSQSPSSAQPHQPLTESSPKETFSPPTAPPVETIPNSSLEELIPTPPPPPPPPLPALTVPPPPTQPYSLQELENVPPPVISDSRANLMKAIQEAGGAGKAKLRKVAECKKEKETLENSSSAPAGDLMSDLFAKLSQRRKGISGTGKEGERKSSVDKGRSDLDKGGHTTMKKISCIIPPPPMDNGTDSDAKQTDDEWE